MDSTVNKWVYDNLLENLNSNKDLYKTYYGDLYKKDEKNYFPIDVTDPKTLDHISNKEIDVIINLAAVHRDDVQPISKYDDVNVGGAVNVCNAARKNNINTIIFTSSVAIYGFAPPDTNESGEPNYFNDYVGLNILPNKYIKIGNLKISLTGNLLL